MNSGGITAPVLLPESLLVPGGRGAVMARPGPPADAGTGSQAPLPLAEIAAAGWQQGVYLPLRREQRSVAALCQQVVSVAEIAARLDLPLGVTRVIVGDMALEGLVLLYRPPDAGPDSDLRLLERVLHGLKNIS